MQSSVLSIKLQQAIFRQQKKKAIHQIVGKLGEDNNWVSLMSTAADDFDIHGRRAQR